MANSMLAFLTGSFSLTIPTDGKRLRVAATMLVHKWYQSKSCSTRLSDDKEEEKNFRQWSWLHNTHTKRAHQQQTPWVGDANGLIAKMHRTNSFVHWLWHTSYGKSLGLTTAGACEWWIHDDDDVKVNGQNFVKKFA